MSEGAWHPETAGSDDRRTRAKEGNRRARDERVVEQRLAAERRGAGAVSCQ
jgi:hypothetical protein